MRTGGRRGSDYTYCPQCGRRTVLFKLAARGEDAYVCTYARFPVKDGKTTADICGWAAYAEPEYWDTHGKEDLRRWQVRNGQEPAKEEGTS